MVTYNKADIKVITVPVIVTYDCPFCGHVHNYEYKGFEEKYGDENNWKYKKFKCKSCGKMFDVADVEREEN